MSINETEYSITLEFHIKLFYFHHLSLYGCKYLERGIFGGCAFAIKNCGV
jgi:hypothetical protein